MSGTRKGFKYKIQSSQESVSEASPARVSRGSSQAVAAAAGKSKDVLVKGSTGAKRSASKAEEENTSESTAPQSPLVKRQRGRPSAAASGNENADPKASKGSSNVVSKSPSSSGASQKSKSAERKGGRAHYPRIQCDFKDLVGSSDEDVSSLPHKDILDLIVRRACDAEVNGLQEIFDSKGASKSSILQGIKEVLSEFPDLIAEACPEDAHFEPEYNKEAKDRMNELLSKQAAIDAEVEMLEKFVANADSYGTQLTNLLKDSIEKRDVSSADAVSSSSSSPSSKTPSANAAKTSLDMLRSIESSLTQITGATDNVDGLLTKAASVQGLLYNRFQQIRFQEMPRAISKGKHQGVELEPLPLTLAPASDPKQIIKAYPRE
jgi:hypothetical protein